MSCVMMSHVQMSAVSTHVSSVQPNILRHPLLTSQGSVRFCNKLGIIFVEFLFGYIHKYFNLNLFFIYQMGPSSRVSDICDLPCFLQIDA